MDQDFEVGLYEVLIHCQLWKQWIVVGSQFWKADSSTDKEAE